MPGATQSYPDVMEEAVCSHCETSVHETIRFCPACQHEARVERRSCGCLACLMAGLDGIEDHFNMMTENAHGINIPNEG